MSIYLRKNALPIFIEIIFVVSCFFVPQEYYIYSNLLFYLLLFADFYRPVRCSVDRYYNMDCAEITRQRLLCAFGCNRQYACYTFLCGTV